MGFIETLSHKIWKFHLNYNLVTSLYMMEPWEVRVINSVVIVVLATMLYSSWVYLPHYTWRLMVFSGILSANPGDELLLYDMNSPLTGNSGSDNIPVHTET